MKKLTATLFAAVFLFMSTGVFSTTTAQSGSESDVSITITEYSDYQCPACAYFHPMVKKLKEQFGDQINLELKYYPLNSHQYAALAARAAESAKNQGKFLEMHNKLFENQNQWSNSGNPTPLFVNYARDIGLDIKQFKEDLNSGETQRTVMEQKQVGANMGVRSTPTFIIDGEQLDPLPRTYAQFEQVVKQYLNEKKSG
jgi:protein-disulfide isomerase